MRFSTCRTCRVVPTILMLLAFLSTSRFAQAQRIGVEAFAGEPFGVGRVSVRFPEEAYPPLLGPSGLALSEANGRVLYPIVDTPEVGAALLDGAKGVLDKSRTPEGRWLRSILEVVPPPPATVVFLFRGNEPLRLTLQSRRASTFTVTPRSNPGAYRVLMDHWWHEYTTRPPLMELLQSPDYPPQVETYLKSTLARRLGLPLPTGRLPRPLYAPIEPELGLLLGTESMRLAMEQDRILGRTALGETADQPLPEAIDIPDLSLPEVPDDVPIEPLAARVPAECFYVRFGSFSNFLWFQDTLGRWRYDLQNLVALRGLNLEVRRRVEESLVMEMSALARLLGETAVADVAFIGTDLAFREGGSFGLLFQARNNAMLTAEFIRQRQERLGQGDGATEEKVTIGDREVSFLLSPDGSARSYYVADGDYHFVTRSRAMMERFLETASGEGALAGSQEFRYARSVMPLDRDDTVFVYVSDAFFQNLVSPAYRLETVRRMQATADVELVELALLASAAEGKAGDTIEQLVAGGLLPPDFGARPDGSRAVLDNGEVRDSLRGRRGAFVAAPDVDVQAVSPSEADDYRQFGEFYHRRWRRLDPMLVGVKRHALQPDRERVVIDARVTPLDKENYARLREELGPAESTRLAPLSDDGVAFEAVLAEQRVFGGLRQINPPSAEWIDYGLWRGIRDWFVGYLGTTGELGVLRPLDAGIQGPVDQRGYASSPGGMWRRDYGQFTLFSLQPDVLAVVAPQLEFVEAQRPAQIRFRIKDVTRAVMYRRLNDLAYARTRETCLGNLRLMHDLSQQLHVPGEDCRNAAELLLDGKLVCPLGGEYVFQPIPGGPGRWTATEVPESTHGILNVHAPEGFVAPPLSWFRGLEAELTATPEALSIHAEVVMQEVLDSAQLR